MRTAATLAVFGCLLLCSCAPDASDGSAAVATSTSRAWDGTYDAPSLLDDDLEYAYAALPAVGVVAETPWAGSYWPTYRDGINLRWAGPGELSPGEKYEAAFNRPGLADRLSSRFGVDSESQARRCIRDSDCGGVPGVCAVREGDATGHCIETWYGLCHAWAPAAILEPEPIRPVVYGGVEFKVNDLKALLTASYDEALSYKMMSLRCDRDGDEHADAPECVDTNPGAFHVVLGNLVGLRQESLVVDRIYDIEVWNQPLRGYEVTVDREIDRAEASELVLGTAGHYDGFSPWTASFREIHLTLAWIGESSPSTDGWLGDRIDRYTNVDRLTYVLELDGRGRVLGGEWTGGSKTLHPDFLWVPVRKNPGEVGAVQGVAGTGIVYAEVKALLDESIAGGPPADPDPNPDPDPEPDSDSGADDGSDSDSGSTGDGDDTSDDGSSDRDDPSPDRPTDTDLDGVPDDQDACPGGDDRFDWDSDGVPDDCDVCMWDNPDDPDGDGFCGDDSRGREDDRGGCAVAPGAPATWLGLAALGGMLRRRRPRVRPTRRTPISR